MRTEYKVVPAPEKARKVKGLKGPDLFAHAIEDLMNEMAADGWVYVRADTLPQEERSGLTSKTVTYRNLLVFRRDVDVTGTTEVPPVSMSTSDPEPQPDPPADEKDFAPMPDTSSDAAPAETETETETETALFPNRQG